MSKKRAFISVFDKTGIVDFAKELIDKHGFEIVSTGGTYNILKENGLDVIEISEITGFIELLEGRVKSLHPNVHAGILARRNNAKDLKDLKKNNISPIDIVVVNLYPFEEMSKKELSAPELVEFIDIGGVTLLRAAAKNYEYVTSVYKPELYQAVLENLEENKGEVSFELRKELALKTFAYTSKYDSLISQKLSSLIEEAMPQSLNMSLDKVQNLRYGENPHQKAGLYSKENDVKFELLHGKELSFNNIADMSAAYNIISEFIDVPAVSIIKHNNPCGVALGENIADAFQRALDCDPISAFGGIIGCNLPVTKEMAKLAKEIFLEVIIAPDFEEEALSILKEKKNLRLVKVDSDLLEYKQVQQLDIKELPFGTLVQEADKAELNKDTFKIATKTKPTEEQIEDMVFAWKVAKHVKSNAIVVVKDKRTIGIGTGQTSRIAAMEIALNQACDETTDAVIASDGFFPATDNIHAAAQARIGAIIQPGGSIKDADVIAECEKYNISMVTTGIRHFKH